jgi:hypothetical protein
MYKTVILSLVLYGCETWSLALKEESRYGVFAKRVLRRIFGPKRNKLRGCWRKLRNEELHKLYVSPIIIRMIKSRKTRLAVLVARMGEAECV